MTAEAADADAGARFEVQGITVRFGGLTALDAVSLVAEPQQVLGIIGPNGAGKTTLFNVLCGFVRPDEGRLLWRGQELRRHRPHRLADAGIARTLQGLGLFPHLSVLENVMVGGGRAARAGFGSALLGLGRSDRDEGRLRELATVALRNLGIEDVASRLPGTLPYPVQKRVALARALAAEPSLLLLDEPASGLSATEMDELGQLIRQLRSTMTVLLVEHHMDLVMSVCDSIVVLNFGKLLATGTPAQIRSDPKVLEAYLGDSADEAAVQADGSGPRLMGTPPEKGSTGARGH